MPHHHPRSKSHAEITFGLDRIQAEAIALVEKMETNFESRDVSVLIDLWQRYYDLLGELQDCKDAPKEYPATLEIEDRKIKFPDIDTLSEFVVEEAWNQE